MKNFVQQGVNLTLTSPYAVSSGGGVLIGNIFGVAAGNAEIGAEVDLVTQGVFDLNKLNTAAFVVGDPVFWDDVEKRVTDDPDDGPRIGVAVTAAPNPSGFVNVRLDGQPTAAPFALPAFTSPADNDKVLTIVDGEVAWAVVPT